MKPEIIKADTAGMIVSWDDGNDVYYIGSSCPPIGNGICYKDRAAFEDKQGICYIPEHDFENIEETRDLQCDSRLQEQLVDFLHKNHIDAGYVAQDVGYTWQDLRDEVYSWEGGKLNDIIKDDRIFELFIDYIQDRCFDECDWQAPSTWLYELDPIEQWENCPQLSCEDTRFDEQGNRKQ